ncbi:hypothetical protein [Comamonas aquatica]|uniref:hypothetical protein n=1 Tax=Comamonas aquatica TaxID=225991 RepID=UPI0012E025DA|nr:hypothetical protein [Comamonas aquatica]
MAADTSHPSFLQPSNPDIWIWRYMDIAKYISFIKDRSLYFTRLDQFDDPYEGRPDNIILDHIHEMEFFDENGEKYPLPKNFVSSIIKNLKNHPK